MHAPEKQGRFFPVNLRLRRETSKPKEIDPARNIVQLSVAIACLEEGENISRVLNKFAQERIQSNTDFLIVISDNGSRGAWKLIESEELLGQKKDALQKASRGTLVENEISQLFVFDDQLRRLILEQYEKSLHFDFSKFLQLSHNRSSLLMHLNMMLPGNAVREVLDYARSEDLQQQLLSQALTIPDQVIHEADKQRPPLTNNDPTEDQKETIRAYGQIFLGEYSNNSNGLRVQIVSGSKQGSFGSVRKYGVEAVKRDFSACHPGVSHKSHAVVAGFDFDSDVGEKLPQRIINSFARNPKKEIILGGMRTRNKRGKDSKLSPIWLSRLVNDLLIFSIKYYGFEQRRIKDFLHAGRGVTGLLGFPNMYSGPITILRGDVLDAIGMSGTWGVGEDGLFSSLLQRNYSRKNVIANNRINIYFSLRGVNLINEAKLFLRRRPSEPYRIKQLRDSLTHEEYEKYIRDYNAYTNYLESLGDFIRTIEEGMFGLSQNEYVIKRARHLWSLRRDARQNGEIRQGWNEITHHADYALIGKIPPMQLDKDEYVSRIITKSEAKDFEQAGEKVRPYIDGTTMSYFLIRRHLYDRPISEIHIAKSPGRRY